MTAVSSRSNRKPRKTLLEYKGNCCRACGVNVAEILERYGTFNRYFEFDHIDPSQKDPNYDNLIRRRVLSVEQLNELDKCVLLCVPCHKVLHAQNVNGMLHLKVRRGNRTAEQAFKCQCIVDYKERMVKFLSADLFLLEAYSVKIGTHRPRLMYGTELYREDGLPRLLAELPTSKRVTIETWDTREFMMALEHISDSKYRINTSVGFQLLSANLYAYDINSPMAWVRNGLALTKDGEITSTARLTLNGIYRRRGAT